MCGVYKFGEMGRGLVSYVWVYFGYGRKIIYYIGLKFSFLN